MIQHVGENDPSEPARRPRTADAIFSAALHLRLLLRVDRTLSIRQALRNAIPPGGRVLDAGCGSGLLSFLALEAGASEVVAVDRHHVDLARDLARANGLTSRIRFVEADLAALSDDDIPGRFDTLLAFIYTNHIVVDEPRSRTVCTLRDRFGGPSCAMVPDRVRYLAIPCDWPSLDAGTELADLRQSVTELESRYGLRLGPLLDAVGDEISFNRSRPNNSGDYEWSAGATNGGYRHRRDGGRFLGDRSLVADIRYGVGSSFDRLPPHTSLAIRAAGALTAIMWIQELWYRDLLIWTAESLSPVVTPIGVSPGGHVELALDDAWRTTNKVAAVEAATRPNAG